MKEIDVFKLANLLGFDVRGANLNDSINSMMIIDESNNRIIGFDSNKVIAYNCKKDINIKRNTVAYNLYKYITNKNDEESIYLSSINISNTEPYIDINVLIELFIEKGLLSRKKDIKKLYKTKK